MFCVLFNANLTFIMGLTGAVFGFILVYVIPIMIHFKCYGINLIWTSENNIKNNNNEEKARCNEHNDIKKYSEGSRRLFYYMFIMAIGVYCLIIQLIAFFDFRWLASEK